MKSKQKITGIVVEYNPFHNGHIHHIQQARNITQCDVLIAVISPHFVQRGEPSIIDKWTRTDYALEHGVDLVIELPTWYALQSAETFANQAIERLALAGCDSVVFGSESNSTAIQQSTFLSERTKKGNSYAASHRNAPEQPNDILAMYYLSACKKHSITPYSIARTNNYHALDLDTQISSASAIRAAHMMNHDTRHTTPIDLTQHEIHHLTDFQEPIRHILYTVPRQSIREIMLVSEGIENLFIKHRHLPLETLIESCISKRYTRSRIRRTLMMMLLNIKSHDVIPCHQFRVLGATPTGTSYLRVLSDMKVAYTTQWKSYQLRELELKATAVYGCHHSEHEQKRLLDQEVSGFILKI